jgi:hypothetical protein
MYISHSVLSFGWLMYCLWPQSVARVLTRLLYYCNAVFLQKQRRRGQPAPREQYLVSPGERVSLVDEVYGFADYLTLVLRFAC